MASSGTPPRRSDSMAMPSSPIKLIASAPSTRSRIPSSTRLNTAGLFAADPGQPVLEPCNLRTPARRPGRRLRLQAIALRPHRRIIRVALQDAVIDLPGVRGQALARVEIGHGHRLGEVFGRLRGSNRLPIQLEGRLNRGGEDAGGRGL